jgi:hypothetical protein
MLPLLPSILKVRSSSDFTLSSHQVELLADPQQSTKLAQMFTQPAMLTQCTAKPGPLSGVPLI